MAVPLGGASRTSAAAGIIQYNSESFDLWGSDFCGGAAYGVRGTRGAFDLFVYHESSHLGDEVLDRGEVKRRDVSVNGVRLLGYRSWRESIGAYGGVSAQPLGASWPRTRSGGNGGIGART